MAGMINKAKAEVFRYRQDSLIKQMTSAGISGDKIKEILDNSTCKKGSLNDSPLTETEETLLSACLKKRTFSDMPLDGAGSQENSRKFSVLAYRRLRDLYSI